MTPYSVHKGYEKSSHRRQSSNEHTKKIIYPATNQGYTHNSKAGASFYAHYADWQNLCLTHLSVEESKKGKLLHSLLEE